jgi:hypothetical protein
VAGVLVRDGFGVVVVGATGHADTIAYYPRGV